MLEIKVLGAGCPNCKRAKAVITAAITENHLDARVVEVTDMFDIMAYGVLGTPAIVINEKVISVGRVPSREGVVAMIHQAQSS